MCFICYIFISIKITKICKGENIHCIIIHMWEAEGEEQDGESREKALTAPVTFYFKKIEANTAKYSDLTKIKCLHFMLFSVTFCKVIEIV